MLLLLASVPAAATTFELGLGVRETVDEGTISGIHAFGSWRATPTFSLDAGVYGRLGGTVVTNLDKTLLAIAYEGDPNTTFQRPITVDGVAIDLLADWSIVPRSEDPGLNGGLRLLGGLSARYRVGYIATVSEAYKSGEEGAEVADIEDEWTGDFAVGPEAGFGIDAWVGPHWGLRWSGLGALALETEPDYGNIDPQTGQAVALEDVVTLQYAWTLDVVSSW